MCGLAGVRDLRSATPGDELRRAVASMGGALVHRGPDDHGVFADPAAGVALAHRRLAIVDLSPTGHQPMTSPSGRFVVVFNGEIYNFRDLRAQLVGRGTSFRGRSDTEVLVAGFEEWGVEETLRRCNGMFALAVWDRQTGVLTLARDRLGEKPLYYGRFGDVVLFGSELSALRRHPAFDGDVDRDALATYLRLGYVPAPRSIHRNVRKLPAGTTLRIGPSGEVGEPRPYWSLAEAARRGADDPWRGDLADAADELEARLAAAVDQRLFADVPVGAFLSGGVDSSTVVALAQARGGAPVRTFTIGFEEDGFNEAAHARAVARHLGTAHTELVVTAADALALVPRLPQLWDEPFADASQIPTHLVSALARRSVTVALSGDGGDELFGGYSRYQWTRTAWATARRVPRVLRRAGSPLGERLGCVAGAAKVGRAARLLDVDGPLDLYGRLVSHWPDDRVLVDGRADDVFGAAGATVRGLPLTRRLQVVDGLTYLPDDILVKVDRASMAVGLECRVPLLDHALVEWALRLPEALTVGDGRGKRVLREVLHRHVPRDLVDRPKQGFGVPIGAWLRGPLRPWAEDLLAPDRLRHEGYLDPAPVRALWRRHLDGTVDASFRLWDVLQFQAWLGVQGVVPVG